MTAVGWGFDAHRLGGRPPLILAGVSIDTSRGVEATSDGDVVAHAVSDAMLGAAALGDIGVFFPSSDPESAGLDSMVIVADAARRLAEAGMEVAHVDVTVIAEAVRIAPHRDVMRRSLARCLGVSLQVVSLKATSTDGLGFLGRDEGIAAVAVVTVRSRETGAVPSSDS